VTEGVDGPVEVDRVVISPDGSVILMSWGPDRPATTSVLGKAGSATVTMPGEGESHGLARSSDGTAWLAGFGRFLAQLVDGEWTVLSPALGFDNDIERDALEYHAHAVDADGAVWGIWGSPDWHDPADWPTSMVVARFDGAGWTVVHDELLSERTGASSKAIAATPDGDVWIGFGDVPGPRGGGLLRFDGEAWGLVRLPGDPTRRADETADPAVHALAVGPDGSLWVYLQDPTETRMRSLARFDGQAWTLYTTDEGVPADAPGPMTVSPDGTVWMASADPAATWGGLFSFDGSIRRHYLPDVRIGDIAVGPDGTVWAIGRAQEPTFHGLSPAAVYRIRP
jgi:hypothetical protein